MAALADTFTRITGSVPDGTWFAPGRVNLIGEHTDYNDGFCMPFALPQRVTLAAAARPDDRWRVHSTNRQQTVEFTSTDLRPGEDPGWHGYIAGVVWALREAGHPVGGADLVLDSDVPVGSGLSSSAALECATLTALCDLYGLDIAPLDRAVLARRAENAYVGAPTGLLDQAASTLCQQGRALFFDCRDLSTEQVPFAPADEGLAVLVLDTNTPHSHVDGEYAERRASCEEAAQLLGVPALRDITLDQLDEALSRLRDDRVRRRVRHVVTENARVLEAGDLLRAGRLRDLGPVLDASHASMRDDFEITVPTVDLAVETALAGGAYGARMTGGGFGGCIIALVPHDRADGIGRSILGEFQAIGYEAPTWFVATPSRGAGRLA